MLDPKGHVWINREFVHTTNWPGEQLTLDGVIDLEKEYKESLSGQLVVVMDIGVQDDGYLVLGQSKKVGTFLWHIEKGDTKGFIPVIKKGGVLIPAGMNPFEEAIEIVKGQSIQMKHRNECEMDRIRREWWAACDLPRKQKKRLRKKLLIEFSLFAWMDDNVLQDIDWDIFSKIAKGAFSGDLKTQ